MMVKYPLICDNCGRVIEWARRAHADKRRCDHCGRHTIFTITPTGEVLKVLAPKAPPRKRRRRRPEPELTHKDIDRMMRSNRYVDPTKC